MTKQLLLIANLLLVLVSAGCERKLPVEEKDKAMILRAGDLAPYGYALESPERYESFTKTRFFDDSYEIRYEFDTPDEEQEHPLYLYVTVTVERNKSDAVFLQGAERFGVMYGLRSGGVKVREVTDFHRYGEASTFYVLEKEGSPIGNLFMVREGGKIWGCPAGC